MILSGDRLGDLRSEDGFAITWPTGHYGHTTGGQAAEEFVEIVKTR